ncbi:T-cell surface antigen CD2-like [Trichomycterus rosablanca]|uniref:T-cell surface antigen CD2-like n=1 Tax=Trichomycterus rosablanca TaxID=2290929 RepID=UPI002F35A22B
MALGAVAVLFLSALNLFTFADSCNITKLVGAEVTLKLDYSGWTESTDLKWKKDKTTVIYPGTNKINNVEVNKGSLVFKNLTLKDAATYSYEIYTVEGQQAKKGEYKLCVLEKVPKPNLNYTCQNTTATLKCDVQGNQDLDFSWNKNGKKITEINKKTSSFSTKAEKGDERYTCTASNAAHNSTSDTVQVSCPADESLLFGFNKWIMIGILAGGGFLVLLLIIVLISCSVTSCHRKEKRQRELDELRLLNLQSSSTSDHKIKQSARGQPAPPVPQDEVPGHQKDQGCVKPQARSRPPPPPVDDEEDPPPLPQPRRKPYGNNDNGAVPYI